MTTSARRRAQVQKLANPFADLIWGELNRCLGIPKNHRFWNGMWFVQTGRFADVPHMRPKLGSGTSKSAARHAPDSLEAVRDAR